MKTWTADEVKAELADAFRVLFAVPVQDRGCASGSGWWPELIFDADEVDAQRQQAIADGVRPRIRPTPRQIRRMELVLLGDKQHSGWVKRFMQDAPALRRVLVASSLWAASDYAYTAGCRRRGWAYSTFKRNRDRAAQFLADRLTEARVELP